MKQDKWKEYWSKNLRLIAILLAIWFLISYGAAAIAPALNTITIPGLGFPLGFWFGSQGSLIGFVLLIFAYAKLMNKMDDEYGVADTTEKLTKAEEKVKIRAN
jgi:putative solute:sodium symporter small subunit